VGISQAVSGVALFVGAALFLIPRTAVLGAIILTGRLGGELAIRVRTSGPLFVAPLVFVSDLVRFPTSWAAL
jgi:hypothetical protein